jgi:small nuclear ribonucleoprotein (snRNP)-like protein
MQDTFAITIIFIVVSTVVGAFIKGRTRDRCLKGFSGYPVTIERKNGKCAWGKLHVENSGLELSYAAPHIDAKDDHVETSYVLYKSEYGDIRALVRYVDDLDAKLQDSRLQDFKKSRNPGWWSLLARRVRNVFGTVRDSIIEVANLFVGRAKAAMPAGKVLEGQDKYTSALQQQAITTIGTSYEPILERYIGRKVVLALAEGEEKEEYSGILKDYTTEFITILDTEYKGSGAEELRKADLVIPRSASVIRHSGE